MATTAPKATPVSLATAPPPNSILEKQRENRKREEGMNNAAVDRARRKAMFDKSISIKTKRCRRVAGNAVVARAERIRELDRVAQGAGSSPPVHPKPIRLTKYDMKKARRVHGRVTPLPVWEHLHVRNKAAYWQRALPRPGSTFTLNLHEDIISRWAGECKRGGFAYQAQQALSGAMRSVAKRLGTEIPRLWFAVDVDVNGRLHLHGGVDLPADFRQPFIDALRKVGGPWDGARRGAQLVLKDAYDPVYWADYALRNKERVQEMIGDSTTGCSRALTRAARKLYDADREIIRKGRGGSA